jgi:hypothetical protein
MSIQQNVLANADGGTNLAKPPFTSYDRDFNRKIQRLHYHW